MAFGLETIGDYFPANSTTGNTTVNSGWNWGGITDWFKGAADVAANVIGAYGTVRQQLDGVNNETEKTVQMSYDPNRSYSDYAFQPNWYLLGGGALLLVIALIIAKR